MAFNLRTVSSESSHTPRTDFQNSITPQQEESVSAPRSVTLERKKSVHNCQENVSFGAHSLFVTEKSSSKNRSRRCAITPMITVIFSGACVVYVCVRLVSGPHHSSPGTRLF